MRHTSAARPLAKRALALSSVYRLLEPGPVVLVTTSGAKRPNVMTMSWHTMMEFEPPLIGCVISARNHSFGLLKATKECVINIPTVELGRQVVGCGNTDFNDPNGGSLECLKSEEECTEECEQRAAQLDGGGLLVYCKCPTSYYKARPCCQVAIAYLPTGGGPYASPFGLCAGLDPYSSCGLGFDCELIDVNDDGGSIVEAECQ